MISVVIPLYNKANSIATALDSVLSQNYQNFEVIVVDDGSTDSGAAIVAAYADVRIRLVRQRNAGVSAARNRGIAEAKGEFVAFLDADDEWMFRYLEEQNRLILKYPQCDVFATNYHFKELSGVEFATILRRLPSRDEDFELTNYFEMAYCSHPPLWTSAVVVRKHVIERIGGFPLGIRSGEDLLTWARLAVKYKVAYSIHPLAVYNLGEGYVKKNLPPRRQDKGDPVGKGLLTIYRENPTIVGLRKYLSHWYKMRASTAIRYGECRETLIECFNAIRYNPLNFRAAMIGLLALLPPSIRDYIIHRY